MKCLFLYNPNSGKGKLKKKLGYIQKTLEKKFETVDIAVTESSEDMTEKACAGAANYDVIVFSGGDGSFNRVLQGIEGTNVVLGYIPAGTANDVARSLGIKKNLCKALKVIADGHVANVDCMKVNGSQYSMYIVAAGAFTPVTYCTPQNLKRALGKVAYAIEGLKHNMKFDVFPVKITADGETYEAMSVFTVVMNGRSAAGFPMNKDASMQDGMLEIAVIKQVEKPSLAQKIGAFFSLAALFLRGIKVRKRNIYTMRGERVKIETHDDVVWDFDGEEGIRGTIEIQTLKGYVKMFVPKKKKI